MIGQEPRLASDQRKKTQVPLRRQLVCVRVCGVRSHAFPNTGASGKYARSWTQLSLPLRFKSEILKLTKSRAGKGKPLDYCFFFPLNLPFATLTGLDFPSEHTWGRYHGGRRPSIDDSFHSPRYSTIGTRQTEHHEALLSSAVTPHLVVRRRW